MRLDILTPTDASAWSASLAAAGEHDIYHEAWYHQLAAANGEGRPELVVASTGGHTLALPVLFRPIDPALTGGVEGLEDATSVYGYPGPVGAAGADADTIAALDRAVRGYLHGRGTVSVFSRLHPLLDQTRLLGDPAQVIAAGATVSIDLRPTEAEQWTCVRSGHRNGINRLRRAGFTCERRGVEALDVFLEIYEATMRRLDAHAYYLFPRHHYEALLDPARGGMELFVVSDPEGTPCAVGLFSVRCGIAQYHLSGATLEHRKHAPTILMLDEARRWAAERGATRLHLGGGVGGAQDSLYDFKGGFGGGRHVFHLWNWIARPQVYGELDAMRRARTPDPSAGFFPIYRAP